MNVFYKYVKFDAWETNIKGDILVQKIKVKKSSFQFLTPLFCYFIGSDSSFFWLFNDI